MPKVQESVGTDYSSGGPVKEEQKLQRWELVEGDNSI
jgi:hypothetical protein